MPNVDVDNTPPPLCLYCHSAIARNEPGALYEFDAVSWRTQPPRGSGYKPEELGYTHLGTCTYGHGKAVEYVGMKVRRLGESMLVSFEG